MNTQEYSWNSAQLEKNQSYEDALRAREFVYRLSNLYQVNTKIYKEFKNANGQKIFYF